MLNYTIGAVRKTKKSTAKTKATPAKKKSASNCSNAGYSLKVRRNSRAGAILAMCKAVSEGKKLSPAAMKKYKVTKADLRRRK